MLFLARISWLSFKYNLQYNSKCFTFYIFYFKRRKLFFLWIFNWSILFRCYFWSCWRILFFCLYGPIENNIYLLYRTISNWIDLRLNNNKWSYICFISHARLILGSSISCHLNSCLRINSFWISYKNSYLIWDMQDYRETLWGCCFRFHSWVNLSCNFFK